MLRPLAAGFLLGILVVGGAGFARAANSAGVLTPADPRQTARLRAAERAVLTAKERILIERPDRQRPEQPVSIPIFGRPLSLGARYTLLTRFEDSKLLDFDFDDFDDRDLDGDGDTEEIEDAARGQSPTDDRLRVNQALQVDLFFPVTDQWAVYLESGFVYRSVAWSENFGTESETIFARGEMWLYAGNLLGSPLSLQIGRQAFFDDREWWWDEDLDAIRLRLDFERFHAEVAVAQEVLPIEYGDSSIDPERKDVLQLLGTAEWEWANRHRLGAYLLYRNDYSSGQAVIPPGEPDPILPCVPENEIPANLPLEAREFFRAGCPDPIPPVRFEDESDPRLIWFGLSANGRIRLGGPGRLYYWLDVAGVSGKDTFTDYSGPRGSQIVASRETVDVLGAGLDVGLIWETRLPGRPSLSLGYAFGSGHAGDTEERDRGFRQTGLQGNSDRLRGVVSFGYYGEQLDPELSNIHILTAGVGIGFFERSSVDLVYHHYRQDRAAPFLRDAGVKRDPLGIHKPIGDEIDLIVGWEDLEPLELKLIASAFRAGKAFGPSSGDWSYLLAARFRLNF
jgi:hypothetical protein